MDVWKYEIISHVEQDISLVRFAHLWDILVNTRNKFVLCNNPCIILYLIKTLFIVNTCNVISLSFNEFITQFLEMFVRPQSL